jgi:hypothetical protein
MRFNNRHAFKLQQVILYCALYFLERDIQDIPLSWRYGIDATKDLKEGENELHLF